MCTIGADENIALYALSILQEGGRSDWVHIHDAAGST